MSLMESDQNGGYLTPVSRIGFHPVGEATYDNKDSLYPAPLHQHHPILLPGETEHEPCEGMRLLCASGLPSDSGAQNPGENPRESAAVSPSPGMDVSVSSGRKGQALSRTMPGQSIV